MANRNYIPLRSNTQKPNTELTIKKAAFALAFGEDSPPAHLPAWSDRASAAIGAIIDFRSAIHKWQAAGQVDESELAKAYDALEAAGLAGWVDELLAVGR